MDEIIERLNEMLDACEENWESDPAYWMGVAAGTRNALEELSDTIAD